MANTPHPALAQLSAPLLAWYHRHRRVLPFREDPTPYHIWVSEIMLQQTRVGAALPYYERFMAALPSIPALAACEEQALMKLWEGLGYYSRARNLQKAARLVVAQYGGDLPGDYNALLALPGIGEYTAGAIASIAFGLREVAVDGNVLRVFSRLLAEEGDVGSPAVKKALTAAVRAAQPANAPGDYNQALMELGALVCTPGTPNCPGCPLAGLCRGRAIGIQAALPRKAAKKPKREEEYTGLVIHAGGRVLLQRRPASGLLAGLWQPPLLAHILTREEALQAARALVPGAQLLAALPAADHVFTHKVWRMQGWLLQAPPGAALPAGEYAFATPQELASRYAVPSAFQAWLPVMAGGTSSASSHK